MWNVGGAILLGSILVVMQTLNSGDESELSSPAGKVPDDLRAFGREGENRPASLPVVTASRPSSRDATAVAVIIGTVSDVGGNPIEGVELTVRASRSDVWCSTDESGRFSISLDGHDGSPVTLRAICRGYDDFEVRVVQFSEPQNVVLRCAFDANWLDLLVVTPDGAPVLRFSSVVAVSSSAAPRTLPAGMTYNRSPVHRVHSTKDGRVRIPTPHAVVDIGVYGQEFATVGAINLVVTAHRLDDPYSVRLTVAAAGTVFGTVTMIGSGTVAENLSVAAIPTAMAGLSYPDFRDRDKQQSLMLESALACRKTRISTDRETVEFELRGLSSGDFDVRVIDEWGRARSISVPVSVSGNSRTGPLELMVERGARLVLGLSFDGKPVSMVAHVCRRRTRPSSQATSQHGVTAEMEYEVGFSAAARDGKAVFDGLPPGPYMCSLSPGADFRRCAVFRSARNFADRITTLLAEFVQRRNQLGFVQVEKPRTELIVDVGDLVDEFNVWLRMKGLENALDVLASNAETISAANSAAAGSRDPAAAARDHLLGSAVSWSELHHYLSLRTLVGMKRDLDLYRTSNLSRDRWTWDGNGPLAKAIESMDVRGMIRFVLTPGLEP